MTVICRRRVCLTSAVSSAALCLAAVAACSSGNSPGPTHPSSTAAAAQPSAGAAGEAAVKSMWQTFFNGVVPIPRRLTLLQNSQEFAGFVRAQAKSASIGGLVLQATAKVKSVTLQPPDQAAVTFAVLLSGKPLARGLHGTAVYSNGRWLVAASTFCSLLRKVYGGKSTTLPSACGG